MRPAACRLGIIQNRLLQLVEKAPGNDQGSGSPVAHDNITAARSVDGQCQIAQSCGAMRTLRSAPTSNCTRSS
jgi:hypothetical protein